ncbi:hypothetical protein Csp1_24220 [Corynebacterium provencense]|uniref:Uncharacterized protein n=1 Tax=Corynebacterium provencense TaxID=1737425 RepID=A0A2Z3YW34_9CORY|nr:hypothetical protein Csp1_24220 [Corynebacterium provencense]
MPTSTSLMSPECTDNASTVNQLSQRSATLRHRKLSRHSVLSAAGDEQLVLHYIYWHLRAPQIPQFFHRFEIVAVLFRAPSPPSRPSQSSGNPTVQNQRMLQRRRALCLRRHRGTSGEVHQLREEGRPQVLDPPRPTTAELPVDLHRVSAPRTALCSCSQALQKSTRCQRVPKWADHPTDPPNIGTVSPGTHRRIKVHCLRRCRDPVGSQREQVVPRDGESDINVIIPLQERWDLQPLRPSGKPVSRIEPHLLAPHLVQRGALCRLPKSLERYRHVQSAGHAPKTTYPTSQTRVGPGVRREAGDPGFEGVAVDPDFGGGGPQRRTVGGLVQRDGVTLELLRVGL